MMAFDPDKYLQGNSGGFDPDAYLSSGQENSFLGGIAQDAGNVLAGAVRGAGSIGATLLTPVDAAARALGVENEYIGRTDRRQAMDEALRGLGADTESTAVGAGKLGSEIAGTAAAGGILGKVLKPAIGAVAPKLLSAVESGGFSLGAPAAKTFLGKAGDMATRMAGGAAVGGAAAGLVDPEAAGTGAAIGAALPPSIKAAGLAGQGLGWVGKKAIGGLTGVGDEALSTAVKAGREGNRAFVENMRGNADMTAVLDDAKSALENMRISRATEYRQGMAGITKDKTILDFEPIKNELSKLQNIGIFKGKVINKNAAGTVDDISKTIDDWAKSNPAEYHTPEGLDALKKSIGDIRDATQFGTPGRKAADQAYNAVKREIVKQAPDYAKVMRGYSEASELISEITRALSLGEKASADTAMRKLQSLMRNNVQTNYGHRLNLARELEQQGGKDILPSVAGQALQEALPRGLAAKVGGTAMGISGFFNPALWAMAPFTSPRLMGEAAYGLGRSSGLTRDALSSLIAKSVPANTLSALANNPEAYMALRTTIPSIALTSP